MIQEYKIKPRMKKYLFNFKEAEKVFDVIECVENEGWIDDKEFIRLKKNTVVGTFNTSEAAKEFKEELEFYL
jgi:hypothetical protein